MYPEDNPNNNEEFSDKSMNFDMDDFNMKSFNADENGFITGDVPIPTANDSSAHGLNAPDTSLFEPDEPVPDEVNEPYGGYGAAYRAAQKEWAASKEDEVKKAEEDRQKMNELSEAERKSKAEADSYRDEQMVQKISGLINKVGTQEDKIQADSKAKKKQSPSTKKRMILIVRIALIVILVGFLAIEGWSRIQDALSISGNTKLNSTVSTPLPDDADTEDDENEEKEDVSRDFLYIDKDMLDSMSIEELAIWYLKEFPTSKIYNENEFEEFTVWFNDRKQESRSFKSEFDSKIAYLNRNPELLEEETEDETPEEADPLEVIETPEPEATPAPTVTPAPTKAPEKNKEEKTTDNKDNTGDTSTSTDEQDDTSGSTEPVKTYDFLPKDIDEYSASAVANWINTNLNSSKEWTLNDYNTLTEFYEWMDEKPKDFQDRILGYLDLLGWTANN